MCRIAAAILPPDYPEDYPTAGEYVINMLIDMQYGGYHSCGYARHTKKGIKIMKDVGAPADVFKGIQKCDICGDLVIGHTRWATSGAVTKENSHPHWGCVQNPPQYAVVHNGTIDNYDKLYDELVSEDHDIRTPVDTELIVHLIERKASEFPEKKFEHHVALALRCIEGTFGIACIKADEPEKLVVAKMFGDVEIGILPDGGFLVASDTTGMLGRAETHVSLEDGELGVLTPYSQQYFDFYENILPRKEEHKIIGNLEEITKQGFNSFMEKELKRAPTAVRIAATNSRLDMTPSVMSGKLGGPQKRINELARSKSITFICTGTSKYAADIGAWYMRRFAGIPAQAIDATQYPYGNYTVPEGNTGIFVSQSGTTAHVIKCMDAYKNRLKIGIVNKVGSTIARRVDCGTYLHIGREIAVPATMSFHAQLAVMYTLAIQVARHNGAMTAGQAKPYLEALSEIPYLMEEINNRDDELSEFAKNYLVPYDCALFFGKGPFAYVCDEAALKLWETAEIVALAQASGTMMHGCLQLVRPIEMGGCPAWFIVPHEGSNATDDELFASSLHNVKEASAQHGLVLALATKGNNVITKYTENAIYLPETPKETAPFVATLTMQQLAKFAGVQKGKNVDQPSALAKSVTVI
jgi:glucosamine--fructose-6-phosphate aminotransferase (isomerizing)